jgi:hypothetical protein
LARGKFGIGVTICLLLEIGDQGFKLVFQRLIHIEYTLIDLECLPIHPILLINPPPKHLRPDPQPLLLGPLAPLNGPQKPLRLQPLANPPQIHRQIPHNLIVPSPTPIPLRDDMVVFFGAGGYVLQLQVVGAGVVLQEDVEKLVGLLDAVQLGEQKAVV